MRRILWIEDEGYENYIEYISPLIREGIIVDIAIDATSAIKYLKENKYDFVIFDLLIREGKSYTSNEPYIGLGLLIDIIKNRIKEIKLDPKRIIVYSVIGDREDVTTRLKTFLPDSNIITKKLDNKNILKETIKRVDETIMFSNEKGI